MSGRGREGRRRERREGVDEGREGVDGGREGERREVTLHSVCSAATSQSSWLRPRYTGTWRTMDRWRRFVSFCQHAGRGEGGMRLCSLL